MTSSRFSDEFSDRFSSDGTLPDDWHAVTDAIHRLLQPQGITATTAQEADRLYVLLEAAVVPDRTMMVTLVSLAVKGVHDASIHCVWVYGRQLGDRFTGWSHEIRLHPELADRTHSITPTSTLASTATRVERFLVCGLGSLGQHCIAALKEFALQEFEVNITAIDRNPPDTWEFDHLPGLLSEAFILGDCRRDSVLERAGIHQCRAILIVTSDDGVNIETAIAARRLNPDIRLVIRSAKENLNDLLKEKLGNFVALEPSELPAATFTLAALGEETLGFFRVNQHQLRVVKRPVSAGDPRFDRLPIHRLHKQTQRLLSYPAATQLDKFQRLKLELPETEAPMRAFYQWAPDSQIQSGEAIVYIEVLEPTPTPSPRVRSRARWQQLGQDIRQFVQSDWKLKLNRIWSWIYRDRTRRVIAIGALTALLLGMLGSIALRFTVPQMSWQGAITASTILLLGGYGDVFGGLQTTLPLPGWVQFLCLLMTSFSLIFILSVLGAIADRILSSKFEFLQRRLPIPQADHVVLVGLGRLGQRVAALLQDLGQPFVCLTQSSDQQDVLPHVPVVHDTIVKGLDAVNLATAKSVILATDDQILNLEAALMARAKASRLDRAIELVIRSYDQRFSDHLLGLLPHAKTFCAYALSAEAFAGAAFGENILSLFRLEDQTVLVTEYQITEDDMLHGKLLAQVAYGYGIVPIFYQGQDDEPKLLPPDETRLNVGDRLVVLSTINGLRRIERGVLGPCRRWQLQALKPLDGRSLHYAGDTLSNIAGCRLQDARAFMNHLPGGMDIPGVIELSLYDHQAYRLVQKLRKLLPVRLVSLPQPDQPEICMDWQSDQILLDRA